MAQNDRRAQGKKINKSTKGSTKAPQITFIQSSKNKTALETYVPT